jgi:hypothetical protein
MINCHLRGSECMCQTHECRAAPTKRIDLTKTPVTPWTARDQFLVFVLVVALLSSCLYPAISRAIRVDHQQFLAEQESRHG